jgi:hypothetical protein
MISLLILQAGVTMEIETKDITSNPLFFNPAQSLK